MANHTASSERGKSTRREFLARLGIGVGGLALGGWGGASAVNFWHTSQNASPPPPLGGYPIAPLTVTLQSGVRVHHIQTGYVAVKSAHRSYSGRDGAGFPALMADNTWTEWMPITAWAIEHPEGVIVIDTGELSAAVTDPQFFHCDPATHFIYNAILRLALTPDDEMGAQLQRLGIPPDEVRWVVQTHLHSDHADGLVFFPKSEVILSQIDYPNSTGTLPCKHPTWLNPTFSNFTEAGVAGFARVMPLTQAGDVFIVPTPGHSMGHQSVVLTDSDGTAYFFAGDASFDEAQLLAGGTAGIASDPVAMRASLAAIRQFAASTPTVYLPSHDPALRTRLTNRQTITL